MTKSEWIVQLIKIGVGIYFIWWSWQIMRILEI